MMGEGGGKEGPREEGRKEEERGKGGLQLRPHTPKASWSPEAPVALGLSLPAEVRQIGRTCRVAPLRMPQVSLAEATPPPQAGLLGVPHPLPRPNSVLGQDQWSGSGVQEASALSLGLLSRLGGGGWLQACQAQAPT